MTVSDFGPASALTCGGSPPLGENAVADGNSRFSRACCGSPDWAPATTRLAVPASRARTMAARFTVVTCRESRIIRGSMATSTSTRLVLAALLLGALAPTLLLGQAQPAEPPNPLATLKRLKCRFPVATTAV